MTKAYELGMKAYAMGISLYECPYDWGSMEADHWERGWLACRGG